MKVDRVRSDGLSNSSATWRPASGDACGTCRAAPRRLHRRREIETRLELVRRQVEDRQELRRVGTQSRWSSPCSSCSVLRVDPHVFGAEIARPHRAAPRRRCRGRLRSETSLSLQVLRRQRRALVERPAVGEQLDAADLHRAPDRDRSRRRRVRRPRRGGPSSGSAPWIAVFTSGELAIARAACSRFGVESRAPVTSTVTSLVAPSPPRTMPIASGSQTLPQRLDEQVELRVADRDAARAVGQREHAVVRRALAVHRDGVERVVRDAVSARCSSAGGTARVGRDERRAWSPSSARSCRSPWPCRRRGTVRGRRDLDRRFLGKRIGGHDGARRRRAAVSRRGPARRLGDPARAPWRGRA